jgi:hypothetical protein
MFEYKTSLVKHLSLSYIAFSAKKIEINLILDRGITSYSTRFTPHPFSWDALKLSLGNT